MESVLKVVTQYGLDTVMIAVVTTIITGILKLPIKKLAQKLTDSHALTRFITFLPVIIGFGVTVLGNYLLSGGIPFGEQSFYLQWVSSASLSFTIYAFWEKFVPSKKKTLTESEIKENLEFLKQVRKVIEAAELSEQESKEQKAEAACIKAAPESAAMEIAKKIILTGGSNVKTTKEQ